jgi:hypothetical protein
MRSLDPAGRRGSTPQASPFTFLQYQEMNDYFLKMMMGRSMTGICESGACVGQAVPRSAPS